MSGLTVADKLALIYTSAGSLRRVAAFTGLSRYRVTKLLMPPELGGYAANAPQRKDATIAALVDAAFSIHKDVCRQVCRAHNLPFTAKAPIYVERVQRTRIDPATGKRVLWFDDKGRPVLGDRVAGLHTRWISDDLRERWIAEIQQTRFYYQISIRSEIDIAVYFDETEERLKRERVNRTPEQWKHRAQFLKKIEDKQRVGYVFTIYRTLSPKFAPGMIAADILKQLRTKHQPAALNLADQYLLQIDTRINESSRKRKTGIKRRR